MENSRNKANSWGMYPTRDPGTPDLALGPGGSPKTWTVPSSSLYLPMMQLSNVVLPQPDGPEKKYRHITTSVFHKITVFFFKRNIRSALKHEPSAHFFCLQSKVF